MKIYAGYGLIVLFTIILVSLLGSCANIIPPLGGPRDSVAPRLVQATPPSGTRNFRGNRITLQFDEYVQVENAFDNVIMTPSQASFPQIDPHLRTISIRIKDTLEPNTTYSIHFGNAVKDINEGNVLKNFSYVFSTGNRLDSFTLSGKVSIAQTGKPDSTLIVLLHRNLTDSAVAKERPRYYTRVDGQGKYTFENLPAGTFRLYALKDEGFRRYTDNKTVFAFADSTITIGPANKPVDLYAFVADPGQATATRAATEQPKESKGDKQVKYQVNMQNGEQDLLGSFQFNFNKKLKTIDSSRIVLADTFYRPVSGYTVITDTTHQKITVTYPWKEAQNFRLILPKDAVADSAGNTLARSDTIRFRTRSESAYGSLEIRLSGVDFSQNPVLQFVQGDQVVRSEKLTTANWKRNLFAPGNYDLRVLYDINKNGIWDTGDFYKHRQPEKVLPVGKTLNVRANWDNEIALSL